MTDGSIEVQALGGVYVFSKKDTRKKVSLMVQLALLAALEVVLTLVYIPIGTINLNFGLVPIVVAAVLFGPGYGALIGGVSGVVTMIQVLTGQSYFYVFLVSQNPVAASLLCVVKTATAGFLAGLVFILFEKFSKFKVVNVLAASVVCPVVNTGIFALGMLTIFGKALMADEEIGTWTTGGLIALVFVVLIGVNFFVELALNIVVCPAISKALFAVKRARRG